MDAGPDRGVGLNAQLRESRMQVSAHVPFLSRTVLDLYLAQLSHRREVRGCKVEIAQGPVHCTHGRSTRLVGSCNDLRYEKE